MGMGRLGVTFVLCLLAQASFAGTVNLTVVDKGLSIEAQASGVCVRDPWNNTAGHLFLYMNGTWMLDYATCYSGSLAITGQLHTFEKATLGNGNYDLVASLGDTSGNVSTKKSFAIDNTPTINFAGLPAVIHTGPTGLVGNVNFTPRLSPYDSSGEVCYSIRTSSGQYYLQNVCSQAPSDGILDLAVLGKFASHTMAEGVYTLTLTALAASGVSSSSVTNEFQIKRTPDISLQLDTPCLPACVAETGTITVTSNDPAPNGGTVTLTWPDGTSDSYSFTGSSATLSFADFGHPAGYVDGGAHAPGSVLTFTADVTTAAGYTASATAQASVVPGGLNVTATPARIVVEPKLRPRGDVKPEQPATAYTTPVDIYVTDMFQQPVSGASISLQVESVDSSFGGHDHGNWFPPKLILPKPTGILTPSSGTTITGFLYTEYTASEFSSVERIQATASYLGCVASGVSADITAQISGLSNLMVNSPHQKIGGTDAHHGNNWKGFPATPDNNHWVSAGTAVRMGLIMSDYAARFNGAGLYINDASLPKGGLFDVNGDWAMPHQTHRRGIDIDVHSSDTTGVPGITIKRLKLLRLADKDLFRGIKDEGNHLHIYFYPN